MQLRNEIDIAAPVARVWELTAAIENWPALTPTITSVERLDGGTLGVGSKARLKQPGQGPAVWTITRFEPGACLEWETTVMGSVRVVARHMLREVPGGCQNVLELDLSGFGSTVLGWLAGSKMAAAIATENAGFKRAAERG